MNLATKLEAILFWKAEPISLKKLAALLAIDVETVRVGLGDLEHILKGRGVSLVMQGDEVMLGTAPEASPLIEQLTREDLARDIGKAGLETLSIILYQGPISRADVDYIRGVNSQFIMRNLLIRGLIERIEDHKDSRSFLYRTTIQLLAHLGISKIEDLPRYAQVRGDIDKFRAQQHASSDQVSSLAE